MAWLSRSATRTDGTSRELFADFKSDEKAATSVEYALIAVVLSGCLFLALPLISTELASTFMAVAGYFAQILAG